MYRNYRRYIFVKSVIRMKFKIEYRFFLFLKTKAKIQSLKDTRKNDKENRKV